MRLTKSLASASIIGLMLALFAPFSVSMSSAASTPTPTGADPLAARLGGSKASFAAVYGKPGTNPGNGNVFGYTVPGFGLVAAAFTNDRASQITIAADRLNHTPLTESDKKDWTVADATKYAQAVVPADATFGNPTNAKGEIRIVGSSASLKKSFKKSDLTALKVGGVSGDLSLVFSLDTAGKVYAVDIAVGNGEKASATNSGGANPTPSGGKSGKTPTAEAAGSASGELIHCRDFKTQAEAQAYFDAHGGDNSPDVAGMDGDLDGTPCEDLT
ncbi:MAG: excalibur calcium-binding domain-containing protein [Thermomicrobiales bacterium]